MKWIILCIALSVSIEGYSQMFPVQREAGFTFYGVNSFGLTYRQGNNKSVWRFNALTATGSKQEQDSPSSTNKSGNNNFSFRFGKEFRAPIADNFFFRYGADISFAYNQNNSTATDKLSNYTNSTKTVTYGPGINLVAGLNYKIKNLVIGAEVMPYYQYSTGKRTEHNGTQITKTDISGSGYGLTSGSALLSVVYQF